MNIDQQDPRPSSPERRRLVGSRRSLLLLAGALVVGLVGGVVGYQIGQAGPDRSGPAESIDPFLNAANHPARPATDAEREALRADGRAAGMSELTEMGQLRSLFDERAGTTRLVALLSPTCVTCLRGANWLQKQLATHPDADVHVYAIWFRVLPSDERVEWDDRILTDARVTHLWDDAQLAGRWYAERGYGDLPVQWDALFVYRPEAQWRGNDEPSNLVIWHRPIIAYADELSEKLQPLLDRS